MSVPIHMPYLPLASLRNFAKLWSDAQDTESAFAICRFHNKIDTNSCQCPKDYIAVRISNAIEEVIVRAEPELNKRSIVLDTENNRETGNIK